MTITLTVTPQTSVEQLANFLNKSQPEDMVFQRKETQFEPGGGHSKVTILYLGKNRRGSDVSQPGHNYSGGGNLRRQTARDTIADILQNATNKATDNKNTDRAEVQIEKKNLKHLLSRVIVTHVHGTKGEGAASINQDALNGQAMRDVVNAIRAVITKTEWIADNSAKYPRTPELPETANGVLEGGSTELTVRAKNRNFPHIEIAGRTFVAQEFLGGDNYGLAVRYKDAGSDTQKLINFPHKFDCNIGDFPDGALEQHQKDATEQIVAGVQYDDPENHVMGFTDHVKLKNGTLALIRNAVDHSEVMDFRQSLNNTKISEHACRLITLTMTQDIAKGVASIHKKGGIHGHVKPNNQQIDTEGRVHLVIRRRVENGPTVSMHRYQQHEWGTFAFNDPKVAALSDDYDEDNRAIAENADERVRQIKQELKTNLKFGDPLQPQAAADDAASEHVQDIFILAAEAEAADRYAIDGKADVFGIGQSTFMLMMGGFVWADREMSIGDESFSGLPKKDLSDIEFEELNRDRQIHLANSPNSHGVSYVEGDPFKNHALVRATGDPVIDLLLDGLLAPNPENRIDDEGVEFHPTMYYAANGNKNAVGSDEVRDLIVAIARDNPEAIAAAMAAVEKEFPEPENLSEFETAWENRADAHLGAKAAA